MPELFTVFSAPYFPQAEKFQSARMICALDKTVMLG